MLVSLKEFFHRFNKLVEGLSYLFFCGVLRGTQSTFPDPGLYLDFWNIDRLSHHTINGNSVSNREEVPSPKKGKRGSGASRKVSQMATGWINEEHRWQKSAPIIWETVKSMRISKQITGDKLCSLKPSHLSHITQNLTVLYAILTIPRRFFRITVSCFFELSKSSAIPPVEMPTLFPLFRAKDLEGWGGPLLGTFFNVFSWGMNYTKPVHNLANNWQFEKDSCCNS